MNDSSERSPMRLPTESRNRIVGLDVLRGVAIFGILVVNVEQLFLPLWLAESPLGMLPGESGATWIWVIMDAFFRNKFLTIFSLLFGAGFALQFMRAPNEGKGFSWFFLRRIGILACFGLMHALFFYMADVLVIYAITAAGLLPLKRLSAPNMVRIGLALWVVTAIWFGVISGPGEGSAAELVGQRELIEEIAEVRETGVITLEAMEFRPMNFFEFRDDLESDRPLEGGAEIDEEGRIRLAKSRYALPLPSWLAVAILDGGDERSSSLVEYAVFSEGPMAAQIFARLDFLLPLLLLYTPFYLGWRTLALFLLGAGLVRMGMADEGRESSWRRVANWGFGIGMPMTLAATYCNWIAISSPGAIAYVGTILHEVSAVILAISIAALVLLITRGGLVNRGLEGLSSLGRTALTNYLGQSVVASFFATSYGFGLFGDLSRLQIFLFACGLFAVQMVVSTLWMRRFRMGPLEWIWRVATYARWLPIRR